DLGLERPAQPRLPVLPHPGRGLSRRAATPPEPRQNAPPRKRSPIMALPVPNLDDRRFQDFVDDAKRLISQRCPAWTDHNVSDPGVTLVELFAFMADQLTYRLNRVPDRQYVTFLDLLGVQLFPPTASGAPLTFWLTAPQPTSV